MKLLLSTTSATDANSMMNMPSFGVVARATLVGGLLAGAPVVAHASAIFTLPTALAAGSGYRLAFASSGRTTATRPSIATYNAFVTSQAAQNGELPTASWTAIVSTAATSAASNVDCAGCDNVPVFLVDGTELAASTNDIFAGSFLHDLTEDQTGAFYNTGGNFGNAYVFTGSRADGTILPNGYAGGSNVGTGDPANPGFSILQFGTAPSSELRPIYALSSELFTPAGTGPAPVPEPASAALLAGGALVTWLRRRKRG